jgi:hypothetical protein
VIWVLGMAGLFCVCWGINGLINGFGHDGRDD